MVEPEAVAAILPLKELGWDTKRIARQLGVSRGPVKRYLEAGGWQPFKKPERRSCWSPMLRALALDLSTAGSCRRRCWKPHAAWADRRCTCRRRLRDLLAVTHENFSRTVGPPSIVRAAPSALLGLGARSPRT